MAEVDVHTPSSQSPVPAEGDITKKDDEGWRRVVLLRFARVMTRRLMKGNLASMLREWSCIPAKKNVHAKLEKN